MSIPIFWIRRARELGRDPMAGDLFLHERAATEECLRRNLMLHDWPGKETEQARLRRSLRAGAA